MPRLAQLAPAELDPRQRELYEAITAGPRAQGRQHFALTTETGSLAGPFNAMLHSPAVGTALQGLGAAIRYRTALDDRCRELAILLVAARWDSAFERDAHEAIARSLGFSEAELAALRAEGLAPFSGAEAATGRAVVALLDGDLDDAQWESARRDLGETAVVELTALVGYYAMLALQLRVFRV